MTVLYIFLYLAYIQHNGDVSLEKKVYSHSEALLGTSRFFIVNNVLLHFVE